MEKREKIMLGLMAATIVVAGGLYLTGPQSPVAGDGLKPGAPVNLEEVTKTLEQSKLPPGLAYRIGVLAENATLNPFYSEGGALSQEDGQAPGQGGAGEIVYSGYMKIGQKVYAVINGVEYARGDELAEGGYVVQGIEKSSVLLERTDGSTGRKFIKRVPLVEDDSDKIRIRVVKKR